MGRGRAKAKQTKVARQLKYSSGGTDLDRLQAELASGSNAPIRPATNDNDAEASDGVDDDPYAQYAEGDDED